MSNGILSRGVSWYEYGLVIILIPTFNDWESAALLLRELDDVAGSNALPAEVVFVDDGSTDPVPPGFAQDLSGGLDHVSILRLRRNLGHQRAIAVGLVDVYQNVPCDGVIVMDGDGEDRPQDIPALLEECERDGGQSIVFAERAKRLEHWTFRALYRLFRLLHLLLTGDHVRVGNFSVIPYGSLGRVVVVPEIWNHYAAAVIRSRLAFQTIPISRGSRLAGKSKMNFIRLLLHGLSAFFVYGEIVGARLLVAIAIALVTLVTFVAIAVAAHLTDSFGALALLGLILLQALPVALILVFTVIGSRVNLGFLPIRDCPYFVSGVERIL
jgi:glycosyltransferase involved in cell wall biosynthesis